MYGYVQVLHLIPGISAQKLGLIFTTSHRNITSSMNWEDMEDLLSCIEMILCFDWPAANVSKTTILTCKVNSLVTEIFKAGVCQDIFGEKEMENIMKKCQRDNFENVQVWIHNIKNLFNIYFR